VENQWKIGEKSAAETFQATAVKSSSRRLEFSFGGGCSKFSRRISRLEPAGSRL
jgi:hypothetical protein